MLYTNIYRRLLLLELICIAGYLTIGFGVGAIAFMNHNNAATEKEFDKFKNEAEQEIKQTKQNKNKHGEKVLKLTKENIELQKEYNNSLRNVELLQSELMVVKAEINASGSFGLDSFIKAEEKEIKREENKEEIIINSDDKIVTIKPRNKSKSKSNITEKNIAKVIKDVTVKLKSKSKAANSEKNNNDAITEIKAKIKAKSNLKGSIN